MARSELKTVYDPDHRRRVVMFRRDDGTFGFEDQRFGAENVWFPAGGYSESFCDTAERAEAEARSRVAWLTELGQ